MVRVEVMVPQISAEALRAYAANLRASAKARVPKGDAEARRVLAAELRARAKALIERNELARAAIEQFGASCLWNVDLSRPIDALIPVIIERLRLHGGHAGWRMATKLRTVSS